MQGEARPDFYETCHPGARSRHRGRRSNATLDDPASRHPLRNSAALRPASASRRRDESRGNPSSSLRDARRNVEIVEPIPYASYGRRSTRVYLAGEDVRPSVGKSTSPGPKPTEGLDRGLDSRSTARYWSVDIDRLDCPYLPICDPVVERNDREVRRGPHHGYVLAVLDRAALRPVLQGQNAIL